MHKISFKSVVKCVKSSFYYDHLIEENDHRTVALFCHRLSEK